MNKRVSVMSGNESKVKLKTFSKYCLRFYESCDIKCKQMYND